jgi:predicted peroxiredoxin
VPHSREVPVPPCSATRTLFGIPLFLLLCVLLVLAQTALAQKAEQKDTTPTKYDLHTEMNTKGVVDEVNLLSFGTRKDFTELIIKSGDDKVHIYVCPKPFQEEMGITFTKGDEIAVTGSKVKQETSDVILVRQLVKGSDTIMFRDDKGNPIWNWHTGK